jgi:hypothetical protein
MRITGWIVLLALICSGNVLAQFTREVPLMPIYKQGWKYFYGGKKMNSAYALQIPLQALDNKQINDRFRKFKTLRVFSKVAYAPAILYLLTNVHLRFGHRRGYSAQNASTEAFALLAAGGIAGDIAFNGLAHYQMSKAIDIYDLQIANKSSLGVSVNPLHKQNSMGLALHLRF